jgi:uncharacterized protein (DUF488 family)
MPDMGDARIYTIGSGDRTLEDLVVSLRSFGVVTLADVRAFPASKRFPQFKREALERSLPENGIRYVWLGEELGGYRRGGYEAHRRTELYRDGLKTLERLGREGATAYLCAEKNPAGCHRRFISWDLEDRGWTVVHILGPGESGALPRTRDLFEREGRGGG